MSDDHCYRAAHSRDGRFDGTFVTAVLSTGIYCRPSCPATTPLRRNVRFYPTPAAAQEGGFRACKRCRPDAAPGSPEWDLRADTVARAVRLIGDGVVEREGVTGLARRVGYTPRQLHRLLTAELGTGALRLAVAHRTQHARALLESTTLSVAEVAMAAGFGSLRQFNDRFRQTYAMSPTEVRARTRPVPVGPARRPGQAQVITAHLGYRPPMDLAATLGFLGRRAVPGVESWDGAVFTASLALPRRPATVSIGLPGREGTTRLRPSASQPTVACDLHLADVRDYAAAVSRVRRLLDLDADPAAVAGTLGDDPLLGPAIAAAPGLRVPGTLDPFETAVRAVVGQQVSVATARSLLAGIVGTCDRRVTPEGAPRAFPGAEDLARVDPGRLHLPRARATAVVALAREVADGRLRLDPGADRDHTERQLLAIPGIGSWTAAYIRMRALGDPDVYLAGDRVADGIRSTDPSPRTPDRWRPWRSYAVMYLWALAATHPKGRPTARPAQPRPGGRT